MSGEGAGAFGASEIEAAATRVASHGRALRARPARDTLKALGDLLAHFADESSHARSELLARLPDATGFTPETIRKGLACGFEPWTGEALERLHTEELGGAMTRAIGADYSAVLLGGSIPMPSVLSIALPLAIGSPVLCKPASRDRITPHVVHETLREIDPLLADCVAIAPFDAQNDEASRTFFSAPCISATGADETITAIERWLAPHQRRVFYRHRVSIAVVDLANVTSEDVGALALDIALWDQLGCLSPIVFYCVGGSEGEDEAFASALAEQLEQLEAELPRGAIDASAAALLANERSDAEMRAAFGEGVALYASSGTQWTVVLERANEARPAPLHRFIRLIPLPDLAALDRALAGLFPHLAGVAVAGFRDDREAVTALSLAHGASRVCAPGTLQTPPLDWKRDNQPLLLGMTSLANVELG